MKTHVTLLPSGVQNPPSSLPHTSQVVAVQELSPPEAQPLTPPAAPPSSIVSKPMGEHQLLGDVSTGEFRPLLPPQFRAAAFHSLHNIANLGIRASCYLVSSRFCWPHLSKQVATLARACLRCQRSKVHKHVPLPFCSRSCRFGWSTSALSRILLSHGPGQDDTLARSHSPRRHDAADCAHSAQRGFTGVGPAVCHSSYHHQRQGTSVWHSTLFSTSPMCRPLPITPRQTALWSAFIAD